MKIFHGDNQMASREALFKLRENSIKKGLEIIQLRDKEINLTEVKQALESMGLFGSDRILILEELFSGPVSNVKKEVIEYLKENKPQNLIIWEGKKIDGRKTNGFEAQEFKVSSKVFILLESIKPGNQRQFLPLMEEVLKSEPVELFFFLLVRQVRQLIEVIDGGGKGPTWLVSKLRNQASGFGLEGLLKFHKELYKLEMETKTGTGVLPLETRLELSLMEL